MVVVIIVSFSFLAVLYEHSRLFEDVSKSVTSGISAIIVYCDRTNREPTVSSPESPAAAEENDEGVTIAAGNGGNTGSEHSESANATSDHAARPLSQSELEAAQEYLRKLSEYYTALEKDNLVSIIYTFASTVVLTGGAAFVAHTKKKNEELEERLKGAVDNAKKEAQDATDEINELRERIDKVKEDAQKMFQKDTEQAVEQINTRAENTEHLMTTLSASNIFLVLLATFDIHKDIFNSLDTVYNLLLSVPDEIKRTPIEQASMYKNAMNTSLCVLKDSYFALLKCYERLHDCEAKAKVEKTDFCYISDIIKDLNDRLNSGFFDPVLEPATEPEPVVT